MLCSIASSRSSPATPSPAAMLVCTNARWSGGSFCGTRVLDMGSSLEKHLRGQKSAKSDFVNDDVERGKCSNLFPTPTDRYPLAADSNIEFRGFLGRFSELKI